MSGEIRGPLFFYSETGTEGGYWAIQDERFIQKVPPEFGVFGREPVWDAARPDRSGKTGKDCEVLKHGEWLPLPDPVLSDSDYVLSSLFRGEHKGDHDADARLAEKYDFRIVCAEEAANERLGEGNWTRDPSGTGSFVENSTGTCYNFGSVPRTVPQRPYGISRGELVRLTVLWEDGEEEERLSDSLLIERWSYDGLRVLGSGDHLTVFDLENRERIVWDGTVRLKKHGLFTQDAFGMWIHADQVGMDRETWARWFIEGYPGLLRSAEG